MQLLPEREAWMNRNLFERLLKVDEFNKAGSVYCYMDCRHEAGTGLILDYLWEKRIPVALPKVVGSCLEFYYVTSGEDLERGCMQILEPKAGLVKAEDRKAFVIVPGLAFDRAGYRLGYGRGYYDRFFESENGHYKLGIGFDFQLVSEVPIENWDIPLDQILIAGCEDLVRFK